MVITVLSECCFSCNRPLQCLVLFVIKCDSQNDWKLAMVNSCFAVPERFGVYNAPCVLGSL